MQSKSSDLMPFYYKLSNENKNFVIGATYFWKFGNELIKLIA